MSLVTARGPVVLPQVGVCFALYTEGSGEAWDHLSLLGSLSVALGV